MNYIKFNHDYDSERLLKIFNDSKKSILKGVCSVTENFSNDKSLDCLFMRFNKIIRCEDNIGLSLIEGNIRPYISPGNNGLIIFPIRGCLEMSFYGYHKIDSSGRPTMSPYRIENFEKQIQDSLLETVLIDQPTVINGLCTHGYKPLEKDCIIFAIKIPLDITFYDVVRLVE